MATTQKKLNVHEKLFEARALIKKMDIKKEGYNKFSNYPFFTPEQIEHMVFIACADLRLLTKFDLMRNEVNQINGYLLIINVDDPKDTIEYQMASEIPSIKATNVVQQLGGAMTYTERYLKMTAFGITENSSDPDYKDNMPKSQPPKKTKTEPPAAPPKEQQKGSETKQTLKRLNEHNTQTPEWTLFIKKVNEGKVKTIDQVRKKFTMDAETEKEVNLILELHTEGI